MSEFEPIAIVGRACVLPGAMTPATLWDAVAAGRVLITDAPNGRWGVSPTHLMREQGSSRDEQYVVSDRGGYVTGFEHVFDERRARSGVAHLETLDPLVSWLLYCVRGALTEAGIAAPPPRTGLIAGNLSYPTEGHTAFVEDFWLHQGENAPLAGRSSMRVDARNRFSSGLPIHLVAEALGLEGDSFAIDAACASSLYAIKLACDRLQDREADLMLAGGVNRADSLFLHLGFTALQALSPTGRSRPFHKAADGLLPSEGAAFVALKRLEDAVAAGDRICGIIRAVGLSNDGRQTGFLAPAPAGQVAALKAAYAQSGLLPEDVAYVECHATGTARGDGVELESLADVWGRGRKPVIGSLKANLGHAITASGAASLLKMLGAFEAGILPPTPSCDEPVAAISTHGFRLLAKAAPWTEDLPARAAISNFGFGGNNAHLIVEKFVPDKWSASPAVRPQRPSERIAIVALGTLAGESIGLPAFVDRLASPRNSAATRTNEVTLRLAGLGFPPNDLLASLPQQTALLKVADEALAQIDALDPERTGVYVGIGCDPVVARYGLTARLDSHLDEDASKLDVGAWKEANAESLPTLTAAGAIGAMPNIPANRLHAQRDWRAPGFTVSSEELSGVDGLKIAARALAAREIDAALVGAADFSQEPAHIAAAAGVLPESQQKSGDAAVALVLMRECDAKSRGEKIIALVDDLESTDNLQNELVLSSDVGESEITARFGHAHAASGLMHVAAAAIATHLGARLDEEGLWPAPTRPEDAKVAVRVESFSGRRAGLTLAAPVEQGARLGAVVPPLCEFFAAATRLELVANLSDDRQSSQGQVRLGFVAESEAALERHKAHAVAELRAGRTPSAPGIHFGEGEAMGEVAFCFTGAAAAYPGAARELLLAFPEIGTALARRFAGTPALSRRLFGTGIASFSPATQLTGCAFVCQSHAELTRNLLGIRPQAAIGLSSGETNKLLAFGVWRDLDDMLAEIDASGLYGHVLTGDCSAATAYWGLPEGERVNWKCWRIAAPVAAVEEALAQEPHCYMTIIHHDEDCVIGGDAAACERVLQKVGRARAIELGLDMVVHCPPLTPFKDGWHKIHDRETFPAPGVRFYTNASNRVYEPTRDSAADASTQQALQTIDFRKTVARAYADGVRVFIEHGPRGILTSAIDRILEGRPHIAQALDRFSQQGLAGLAQSLAALWAAGVPMNIDPFAERLSHIRDMRRPAIVEDPKSMLRLPAHRPDVVWPAPALLEPMEATVETPAQPAQKAPEPAEGQEAVQVMTPPPDRDFALDIRHLFEQRADPTQVLPSAALAPASPTCVPSAGEETIAKVVRMHTDFLVRQKEVHDAFLAVRAAGLQVLQGQASAVATEVAFEPSPPVAPPATKVVPGPVARPAPAIEPVSPPVQQRVVPQAESAKPKPLEPRQVPSAQVKRALSRVDLEAHASGKVSDAFGPMFARQDNYLKQVRMPEPPLLLADRALTIEGEPGAMGRGRVVTQTDVKEDAWYLHDGRMSPGLVIESGQADLLLISFLGADFLNKGERVYRLLGCDLTFYGGLPKAGETLTYDIKIDGHAKAGDVRLFFFQYDCKIGDRLLISVRNGQAGFFSDEELAESDGVLWSADEDEPKADARLDPPPQLMTKRSFTCDEVAAFVAGDAYACFGEGFELAASHTRTPNTPSDRLALFDEVPVFEPNGGPWGRGYLRATAHVPVDEWFYKGHFKNDPCMPGTLMADAAVQAIAFAMAAMGFTIRRDGWRFEPVPEEMSRFVCRGQVIPDAPHDLDYEVFIEEVIDGETPTVFAALLCKSDGLKVFGCRRFGLRLVPDWPLETRQEWLEGAEPKRLVGPEGDVRGDYGALLACAWGRPTDAFGQMFADFDGTRRGPRLPGPPYHFMTRIVSVDVAPGDAKAGATVISEYDVPCDAWYFAAGEGEGRMPFAVLLEILLQPCGWLSSYLNFVSATKEDIAFRNLDGDDCLLHRIPLADIGTLRVTSTLTRFAQAGGTTIVFFDVTCTAGDELIMTLTTDFGFFSPKALASQVGLPTTDEMRARLTEPSPTPLIDLTPSGGQLESLPGMSGVRLRMLDEITGFWPEGGPAGLGRLRARQRIAPRAWYFQAHFFQDPVQPGSLGLEALIELAHALIELQGWAGGIADPEFEPLAKDIPLVWRYRGQVVPTNKEVVTEIEALSLEHEVDGAVMLTARGHLWVDGLRIYETPTLSVRVKPQGH